MRSICKKGSAIFVAALALCVVASASASAAQWYVGGKALSGSEKLAETVKVEENIKFSILEATQPNLYAVITCTEASFRKPEILASASFKTNAVEFENCKLEAPGEPHCELRETTLGTKPLEGKVLLGAKSPEDIMELYGTDSKQDWSTVSFRNCNVLGEAGLPLHGAVKLKAPTAQTEAVEQEFAGEGEASKELFGWNKYEPWYVYGAFKAKLASGKAWSFH